MCHTDYVPHGLINRAPTPVMAKPRGRFPPFIALPGSGNGQMERDSVEDCLTVGVLEIVHYERGEIQTVGNQAEASSRPYVYCP
jgi:hypothetical protein